MFLEHARARERLGVAFGDAPGEDAQSGLDCPSCMLRSLEQKRPVQRVSLYWCGGGAGLFCPACDLRYDEASWLTLYDELASLLLERLETVALELEAAGAFQLLHCVYR